MDAVFLLFLIRKSLDWPRIWTSPHLAFTIRMAFFSLTIWLIFAKTVFFAVSMRHNKVRWRGKNKTHWMSPYEPCFTEARQLIMSTFHRGSNEMFVLWYHLILQRTFSFSVCIVSRSDFCTSWNSPEVWVLARYASLMRVYHESKILQKPYNPVMGLSSPNFLSLVEPQLEKNLSGKT